MTRGVVGVVWCCGVLSSGALPVLCKMDSPHRDEYIPAERSTALVNPKKAMSVLARDVPQNYYVGWEYEYQVSVAVASA